MAQSHYTISTMTREEIDIAVDWAAAEGWNPGLFDGDCFHAADPGGFLMGKLNNEPVATISAVKYGNAFGFVGFYIVKPEYRGKGYGIRLWNAALVYLEGRNIGLDGVVAQQENYRKSGFKLAYRNIRHEGSVTGQRAVNSRIVKLSTLPFETVDLFDRPFFPATRAAFLRAWITQPESNALGIMRGGKLAGYGVIRKCRTGYKVGPLIADSPDCASDLFIALQSGIAPGTSVYLDTPEVNADAVALAKAHRMKAVFETARMYTTENPPVPLEHIFGVTTFELG